jgi:hypothetical protein
MSEELKHSDMTNFFRILPQCFRMTRTFLLLRIRATWVNSVMTEVKCGIRVCPHLYSPLPPPPPPPRTPHPQHSILTYITCEDKWYAFGHTTSIFPLETITAVRILHQFYVCSCGTLSIHIIILTVLIPEDDYEFFSHHETWRNCREREKAISSACVKLL